MGKADLSSKKKFIKATLTQILDAMEEQDESSSSSEEEEVNVKTKNVRGKGKGGGGLTAVKEVSKELASFLGKGDQMARTGIVKALWEYIKDNDLQNPKDKREIILDSRMKEVFHVDRFTMFSMNKYVGAHIHPFTPVNLNELSANSKKRKQQQKERTSKKGKTTVRKSGTQTPYRLSPELIAITGKPILPRPQIVQALWSYIRKNGLQNPDDKREILCDDSFRKVMGGNSKVTMFTMQKHITPHLLEKVDKSEYQHEEPDKPEDEELDEKGNSESDDESDAS